MTALQISQMEELKPAAAQCLLKDWIVQKVTPIQGPRCTPLWDGIYCWLSTPIGGNIAKACPNRTIGSVTRYCLYNSTWYWNVSSNYTACMEPQETKVWPMMEIIRYTLFVGSVTSFLFLSMSLFLFCRFKAIRCHRITIHIHFMVALAMKCSVLILISDPTPFSQKYYYRDVDWICKLVIIMQMYSFLASVNWMLIQGHFLNSKLSTDVFQRKHRLKFYYCFGWGFPCPFVLFWYVMMQTYQSSSCWRNYSKSAFVWIIVAPMFTALMVNLAFLARIIKILLTKAKTASNASDTQQFRRASKATAFLFPLLGINNLIFFFNPGGEWQARYLMTNAVLQPLQGVLVSVLYCFICTDVHDCIRREYRKFSAKSSITPSIRFSISPRGRQEVQITMGKCCPSDSGHSATDVLDPKNAFPNLT